MKTSRALKSAAWAAAGAALLGGGMFLGFFSALLDRKRRELSPTISPPQTNERIEQLTLAVADLQKRVYGGAPADKLESVSRRVEQLEQRVEQLVNEPPGLPAVDQVLEAVEQMVSAKIGGLDERLTDQVQAIDLLRTASAQTDALLQKLLEAVETLAERNSGESRPGPSDGRDYPVA